MEPRELAVNAARRMLDKGAEDLVILAIPEGTRAFDFVVVASGRSERQVATLVAEVYHLCKRHQIAYFPVEGEEGWRLIDCHEVVVHAFTEDARGYYDLEGLYRDATALDHEALLAELPDPDLERDDA